VSAFGGILDMAWEFSIEGDARFRRILYYNLIGFLLLGLAMPYLPVREIDRSWPEEAPPRLARLIIEVKPPPPPPPAPSAPVPEPASKPASAKPEPPTRPVAKPQPVTPPPGASRQAPPVPVKQAVPARKQAEQSGLLALSDTLSDMRRNNVASSVGQTRDLLRNSAGSQTMQRAVLTAGTTSSSGGIRTAGLSRDTGGGALAEHITTQVHSPVQSATGSPGGTDGRAGRTAGRSIEEIQMVFDRNKGAIYSVYNRALRQDPTLQGKLVLRLTIAPSGKVTRCDVVSSELQDAAVAKKIAQRVKLFDFGGRDVSEVTISYPIDFLPA